MGHSVKDFKISSVSWLTCGLVFEVKQNFSNFMQLKSFEFIVQLLIFNFFKFTSVAYVSWRTEWNMKISDDREFESPFGFAFVDSKCYNIRLSCEYAILSDILPYWCRLILSCSLYTPSLICRTELYLHINRYAHVYVCSYGPDALASSCFLCNYYYANSLTEPLYCWGCVPLPCCCCLMNVAWHRLCVA